MVRTMRRSERPEDGAPTKRRLDRQQLKDDVIKGLGGKCYCYGESERLFLELGHSDGSGGLNEDRDETT